MDLAQTLLPEIPILGLWHKKRVPVRCSIEEEFGFVEALLRIRKSCSKISVIGLGALQDLTEWYLAATLSTASATPEGIELVYEKPDPIEEKQHGVNNGFYVYDTQIIRLYPFAENFDFARIYIHELTHALDDCYCSLESVRALCKVLRQLDEASCTELIHCLQELLDMPQEYYRVPKKWDFCRAKHLQEVDGKLLGEEIQVMVEFLAYAIELCAMIWNRSSTVEQFTKKVTAVWSAKSAKHKDQNMHKLACSTLGELVRCFSEKVKVKYHNTQWFACLSVFLNLLQQG
jgi:hypothetical protein